jgi:hypothetical protein
VADIKVFRKDLIVATQGRAFWIMDNVSSLHQLNPQVAAKDIHLYAPRDGYRTRDGAAFVGPTVEYYLASVPAGPVTIRILDGHGEVVNSFSSGSGAAAGAGARRDTPRAMMMAGRGGRGGFSRAAPVTRNEGHNRWVWNVQHESGLGAPPGEYEVRLTVGGTTLTQPLAVLIDPRLAEEGLTAEDLQEQFRHNLTMRTMVEEVNALVSRVEDAQERLQDATGRDAQVAESLDEVAGRLITGPIRYSAPGLQTHISYLAGMTSRVDQKVGRDALERYQVLRAELDEITAEVNRLIGSGRM